MLLYKERISNRSVPKQINLPCKKGNTLSFQVLKQKVDNLPGPYREIIAVVGY